ncbi:hypothetical protein J6590_082790 [Homalodisca vitripennis]|nr:hypothetical protein J6590_082790 [Homalodisca vitripennis]
MASWVNAQSTIVATMLHAKWAGCFLVNQAPIVTKWNKKILLRQRQRNVSRLCSLLLRFDCPPTVDAAAIWWRLLVTWYTPVSGRLVAESAEWHYRFWRVTIIGLK